MTEPSWRPVYRAPRATVTRVLQSAAFLDARERAAGTLDDPVALRSLADAVEAVDTEDAPLSAIADRVAAAVAFLRAKAEGMPAANAEPPSPGRAARERLIVSALDYLVTPVDLIPDFRAGGYLDDAVLLSWVFGAAVNELEPFMDPRDGMM